MQDPEPPHVPVTGPEAGGSRQLAGILRQYRMHILEEWERAYQLRYPERPAGEALLHDHVLGFLDRLAEAEEHGADGTPLPQALSDEHALDRLEQGYAPGALAEEYGLLRGCILRVLAREGLRVDYEELVLLDEAIDQGIVQAVTGYARTRERMLRALERISQAALESDDLDSFLSRLLEVLMGAALGVEGASILLREGDRFRLRAATGLGAREQLAEGYDIGLDEGLTGWTASRRQPVAVRFASSHPLLRNERVRRLGLRAAYCVPMMHRGEVIGVANMGSRTVFAFSESDLLFFRTMIARATAFVVHTQLAARERAARDEAQRSLAQLDTLLRSSAVGIGLMDRELRFLRLNDTLAALNKRPVEHHLGRTFREVVPPWVADRFEPVFRQVLETGEPRLDDEFLSAPDAQGTAQVFQGNYHPVRTESGEVLGLGCVLVDITAHKRVEAELRREAELREQLIAVVGHDLRNPLNAITASAWQLSRAGWEDAASKRPVERIRHSAARMTRMLADILDFARGNAGHLLPVHRERMDLHALCRVTLEELQVAHPARRLELRVAGDGWGWWDSDRMAQVVGNLVSNALQHGAEHTPVRVTVEEQGEGVRVAVHNEGPPISPELQETLFHPFRHGTTGKAVRRSVGLGLYIVQQVALAHGGHVHVHSSATAGTTFSVWLPRHLPAPTASH
jgi:PAS domain S-box-containing protein